MQTNSLMQIINSLAPILLITLIFIFFVFRPQYKKATEHKKMLLGLKIGENVILTSGIIGEISNIDGEIILLKISKNQEIKILKNSILEIFDEKKYKK